MAASISLRSTQLLPAGHHECRRIWARLGPTSAIAARDLKNPSVLRARARRSRLKADHRSGGQGVVSSNPASLTVFGLWPDCPTSETGGCPGCAAVRSPHSLESASSTTPSWNAARWPGCRPPFSTRLPEPCSLTTPNEAHLFHLASAAEGTSALLRPHRRNSKRWALRTALQWTLDAITAGPAIVRNGRMDLLATNHLGRAMHSSLYDRDPSGQPNFAPLHLPRRRLPPLLLRLDTAADHGQW
jgi:hypothetical protein